MTPGRKQAPPAPPQPIADLHGDTLLGLQGGASLAGYPEGHVDLPRLRRGRVGLQVFVGFVSTTIPAEDAFSEATALLDLFDRACGEHGDVLERTVTAEDVERAAAGGRIAAVAAIENGHAIDGQIANLEALARRGVRYMTLTHSRHLAWAASSGEDGDGPGGLTAFGREVVAAMNALGVIVDISHVHATTFWDVARVARRPFIASHSCAAALCPMARNLTDDQLKAVADSGGLIGINFYPGFLDAQYFPSRGGSIDALFGDFERIERETLGDPGRRNAEMNRVAEAWRRANGPADADVDTVCDHVEHVARIAGDAAVAFGSDFDGVPDLPRGLSNCGELPAVLERLGARGWSEARLRKLAWSNALRVLRANE